MSAQGILRASCAVLLLIISPLVTTGRRSLVATQGHMDTSDPETGLTDANNSVAQVHDHPGGRTLQNQETSLVQHKNVSGRVKSIEFCKASLDGVLHCDDKCKCGWGQQCYPKERGGPKGVCEAAMLVLVIASFLLFVAVFAGFVVVRTFLQWLSLDSYEQPAPAFGFPKKVPSLDISSMSESSSAPASFNSVKQTDIERVLAEPHVPEDFATSDAGVHTAPAEAPATEAAPEDCIESAAQ